MQAMSLANQVPDFSALRVAVVGDLIADHYLQGRPSRLSREAPVMILQFVSEEIGGGGAANMALNLWALGARTRLIGAVGHDASSKGLLEVLSASGLATEDLLQVEGWITPTKTRVLGAEPRRTTQQMLRIDREPEAPLDDESVATICERVRSLKGEVDVLLISDYGYGTVGSPLAEAALELQRSGISVVLDPRHSMRQFAGITAMTPNLSELARCVGKRTEELEDPDAFREAAQTLLEDRDLRYLMVTMGNRGMTLFDREEYKRGVHVGSSGSEEVIDVSGAGDTAAATFALALATGVDGASAMRMANASAGVVVMESGTAVCGASKLRAALPKAPMPVELEAGD